MDIQNLPWYGQLGVFLVIGGIIFGIFYFAYYSDNQVRITQLNEEIDKLEKEIRGLEKKKSKIKEMEKEVAAKEAILDKLKEILPETKEISQIIKKVQSILSSARLEILNWTSRSAMTKNIYNEHPYAFSIEGNYHNLAMFFDQLSKLKKIFTVNNLAVSPLAKNKMTRAFSIKATFTASTYTFVERQAAAAATQKAKPKKKPRRREQSDEDELKGI